MKTTSIWTAFLILVILLVPITGCSGGGGDEGSALVVITYTAAFRGETPSGDLNLVMDVTIENNGYETFDISPSIFVVEVAGHSYKPYSSKLPAVQVTDGENLSGSLTFRVPPQAATSRVGYQPGYSGDSFYNVQWVKAEMSPANNTPPANPVVNIAYSTDFMWISPPGIGFLKVEPPGVMYLMVEMSISNRGYESFRTMPDLFSLDVSSPAGSFTTKVEGLMTDWRDLNLQNNAEFIGLLAFPIPREVTQSFYEWDYQFKYNGIRNYNIQWLKLNTSKHLNIAEMTDLESINLKDGEVITGQIGYAVAKGVIDNAFRYKMFYDYDTNHNVQWSDQPDLDVDINRDPIKYPAIKVTYSLDFVQNSVTGRSYVIVDVTIENRGYESFNTSPGNFYIEVEYY